MLRQAHDPERMNGGPGDWQRGKGFERVSLVSLRVRLWRIESWGEGAWWWLDTHTHTSAAVYGM